MARNLLRMHYPITIRFRNDGMPACSAQREGIYNIASGAWLALHGIKPDVYVSGMCSAANGHTAHGPGPHRY